MDNLLQNYELYGELSGETGHYILSNVDEIMNIIRDQIISTETFFVSKYIAPCKQRAIRGIFFFVKLPNNYGKLGCSSREMDLLCINFFKIK
jgi:hypothetical protein